MPLKIRTYLDKVTIEEVSKIMAGVVRGEGCWAYPKGYLSLGYRHVALPGGRILRAHRLIYAFFKGEPSTDLVIDHLCRNTACVNPRHLEAVTAKENALRGIGIGAKNAVKTHCSNGHLLSGENVYHRPDRNNHRECRACHIMWRKEYWKVNRK